MQKFLKVCVPCQGLCPAGDQWLNFMFRLIQSLFRVNSDKCHPKWFWEEELKTLILVQMPSGLQQNHLSFCPLDFLPLKVAIKLKTCRIVWAETVQLGECLKKCISLGVFWFPELQGWEPQCRDQMDTQLGNSPCFQGLNILKQTAGQHKHRCKV